MTQSFEDACKSVVATEVPMWALVVELDSFSVYLLTVREREADDSEDDPLWFLWHFGYDNDDMPFSDPLFMEEIDDTIKAVQFKREGAQDIAADRWLFDQDYALELEGYKLLWAGRTLKQAREQIG